MRTRKMLFMRSVHYNPTGDPSGRLRLFLVPDLDPPPLLAPPVFIGSAGEWAGGEGTLMNDCGLRMKHRKYSEGRKDHWFVSESNGLSYASKFSITHSSRRSARAV